MREFAAIFNNLKNNKIKLYLFSRQRLKYGGDKCKFKRQGTGFEIKMQKI